MTKNSVVIRISKDARERLKIKALQGGYRSMMAYMDALSRVKIDKSPTQ